MTSATNAEKSWAIVVPLIVALLASFALAVVPLMQPATSVERFNTISDRPLLTEQAQRDALEYGRTWFYFGGELYLYEDLDGMREYVRADQ